MDTSILTSERGVSPVIGVVLMVAITVILATAIGSVVLGMTGDLSTDQPQVTVSFAEDTNGDVTITHEAGDSLDADRVEITVDGTAATAGFSGTIESGDKATLNASAVSSGSEILVEYELDSGDIQVLASHIVS